MTKEGLATHESIELHELLVFKTCCLTKSSTLKNLVSDDELRDLLERDTETSKQNILELKGLLDQAQLH
jgi:similar to spore coat protein